MASTPEEKRARLAKLLREKARAPRRAPASFAQERMWFLEQWSPGSASLHMPVTVRLHGELEVEALQRALQELVLRHETLRTTFSDQEGRPLQVIAPVLPLPLPRVDLRELPEEEREARARQRLAAAAREPFDLAQGPLLRTVLLRLGAREHLLLLNVHHLVSDGWSMGVLVRELATLYRAALEGRPAPLTPLPLQYADYAAWQREWLQGEVLESLQAYWRARLAPGAVLELPTDRPRPAILGPQGARRELLLPRALVQALQALSQREGTTLFVTLLAAFKTLLHRYTGQSDLVVGSPVAGRSRAELEGLIGLFVNTLVLRTALSGQPTFRELMGRVHATTVEAQAHQDLPFEKLVELLEPARNPSHSPLFQVMFVLQNTPMPALELPGLSLEAQPVDTGTSKFDLTLLATELPQGLRLTAEYSTDLFDAETAARLLSQLHLLLTGIAAHPERSLAALPLLPDAERHQLLFTWNQTRLEVPRETCLPDLFQAQVARTPEAIALVSGDAQLTYRRLHERVLRLSRRLQAAGVGPDVVVGLCAERSPDMVAGMLAILHAGGAYLPLDPSYPAERLACMLEDSGTPVLLTQPHLAGALPSGGQEVLLLGEGGEDVPSAEAPPARALLDALAYVLYTSGSTGRPKGVMVPHRAVANLFAAMDALPCGATPGAWLAVTSFSFDISVLELLWTLSRGHQVVLHDEQAAARKGSAPSLVELVRRHRITHLQCTPSFARALLLTPEVLGGLSGLRHLLVAGEALPGPLAQQLRAALPAVTLMNLYGPTETTLWSSTYTVTRDEPATVPIGMPVANTRIHVLDAHLQPTPIGVPGELFIAGEGVGRGYLRRPELTAERFLPEPFSPTAGERMYRTGDLARWRPDGTLEFLGRTDFQVKVRGFRIELGEVEATLSHHPDVLQAVVTAQREPSGDLRLIGYLVPRAGRAIDVGALRESARQRLPEHMVPSLFVALEALPLTPNGKVDRKALPAPAAGLLASGATREYVAPRNELEQRLAGLYAGLLRVPEVGAFDDFFALGGHSLLATQAVSRLRATFGVELPVRTLFEAPTVAALAGRVEGALSTEHPIRPLQLHAVPRTGPLPLSFAQNRMWSVHQLHPGMVTYNMPIALRMEGELDVTALERALTELARRHEALRTHFRDEGGTPTQVIAPPAPFPLPIADLTSREDREAEAHRLAGEEATRPFDLTRGPLFRGAVLKLEARVHVLLLTVHHIVFDGWSMSVMARELVALYRAFRAGQPSPLPELPIQYADFAAWQRQWLRAENLEAQLEWWKHQLAGAPHALELPTDFPRPPQRTFRGAALPFHLPPPLAGSFKDLCQREGATLFMGLLAAYQAVLARAAGQDDVIVGTPIAGRRFAELENLLGLFINVLALRTRLDGDPSFRQVLGRVREMTLGAYAHQDIPFWTLLEELQPAPDPSRTPYFQVMLVLQSGLQEELKPSGLTFRSLQAHNGTAKFELALVLTEAPRSLAGYFEYNTDLFRQETVARLAEHLRELLEAVAPPPEAPLSTLPLSPREVR